MALSSFRCPICAKKVPRKTSTAPFCSQRCRHVDLGRWFAEEYRVAREIFPDDGWDDGWDDGRDDGASGEGSPG